MKELSLFTGIGGGLLGTMLLGWRCVGAVEWEPYPCKVLAKRQEEGFLDDFPIRNMDIREFNGRLAPSYTGLVDVVTAGFPCQPFSTAGKRNGKDDARNMWPATIECINVVRPKYALLENVPGLLSSGYFGTILGDLAESGYDARWRILSAAEMGAPHKRDRLFIVANSNQERWSNQYVWQTHRIKPTYWEKYQRERGENWEIPDLGAAVTARLYEKYGNGYSKPDILRVVDGIPGQLDRLKAIGNAQVPAVVAAVWQLLTGE